MKRISIILLLLIVAFGSSLVEARSPTRVIVTLDENGNEVIPREGGASGSPVISVTENKTATIAISQTDSDEVDLMAGAVVGIIMPAAWDAADIQWKCSLVTAGSFLPTFDGDGVRIGVKASASQHIDLTRGGHSVGGCRFLKVISSATQTAERIITLIVAK